MLSSKKRKHAEIDDEEFEVQPSKKSNQSQSQLSYTTSEKNMSNVSFESQASTLTQQVTMGNSAVLRRNMAPPSVTQQMPTLNSVQLNVVTIQQLLANQQQYLKQQQNAEITQVTQEDSIEDPSDYVEESNESATPVYVFKQESYEELLEIGLERERNKLKHLEETCCTKEKAEFVISQDFQFDLDNLTNTDSSLFKLDNFLSYPAKPSKIVEEFSTMLSNSWSPLHF